MNDIEKVISQFNNAQEFNSTLKAFLDKDMYLGSKTPKEWKRFFLIKLPEDIEEINFQTIIAASADIFTKYQQAASLRDRETIQLNILEQSKADKYNEAYQIVRVEHENKFNKGLSARSCEIAASLAIKDIEDAITNQKLVKEFWKQTCETLTELRKLLEIMGYALSNDVRINRDFNVISKHNN
jgi:hypothetical protein